MGSLQTFQCQKNNRFKGADEVDIRHHVESSKARNLLEFYAHARNVVSISCYCRPLQIKRLLNIDDQFGLVLSTGKLHLQSFVLWHDTAEN